MHLLVKQAGRTVNEFEFRRGPVYIGRHIHSQIFLPGKAVSRQHAVIFNTPDGKWFIEDLDSANKTYLNDEMVQKAEVKTGDTIRITDFTVEINLEENSGGEKSMHLDDTLVTPVGGLQTTIRNVSAEHASDVRLPAKRIRDFVQATEAICEADNLDQILQRLVGIIMKQFAAFHTWCALRDKPTGAMVCAAGKQRDGRSVQLKEIKLADKIDEAVEKGQFMLLSRLLAQREEKIQSVLIAPLITTSGCFGVLYVDNAMDHESYSQADLDYLMLLAIHTATIIKNF
jgi:pSer/pThr/pTyr-binding forkhead associated (FHA) protein